MVKSVAALAVLTALSLAIRTTVADVITENPNALDSQIANNGSGVIDTTSDNGDYQARIGEFYSPGGAAYVAPFLLPTLPAGQVFTAANLQTQLFGENATTDISGVSVQGNADLYVLNRISASPTLLASDYYQGALDTSNTLLQAGFYNPTSVVRTDANTGPFTDTNTAAGALLVTFLNNAEAAGDAGDYIFLRLNYNLPTIPVGNDFYAILTENAGGSNEKPILTLTTGAAAESSVPEPASLALLAIGSLSLLRKRK
jgi:hypothetical protein